MKLDTAQLKKAFALVAPIAKGAVSALPILSHVRLSAGDGRLMLSACDLECQVRVAVCAMEEEINVCLPVDRLGAFLPHCEEEIRISPKNGRCELRSGGARASVGTLPGSDLPEVRPEGEPVEFTHEGLRDMVAGAVFACAKKDVRTFTHAVCAESDGRELTCVASDGHIMAIRSAQTELPKFRALLHKAIVPHLAQAAGDRFSVFGSAVGVKGGGVAFLAKTWTSDYFDWRGFRSRLKPGAGATVERAALIDALRLALPFVSDGGDAKSYPIDIVAEDGALRIISVAGLNRDEAEAKLAAEGAFPRATYNARHVMAIVEHTTGNEITLCEDQGNLLVAEDGATYITTQVRM